jgi:hypothetical protein
VSDPFKTPPLARMSWLGKNLYQSVLSRKDVVGSQKNNNMVIGRSLQSSRDFCTLHDMIDKIWESISVKLAAKHS